MRLDVYLVENGFCESRSRASRLIGEGKILLDGKIAVKAGQEVSCGEHTVEITEAGEELKDEALSIPYEMMKHIALSREEIRTLYQLTYKLLNEAPEFTE